MAVDVSVPSVGESISEVTVVRWTKPDGAAVIEGEILFEIETDKAGQDIPAPASGVLKIITQPGERVAVGAKVATIDPAGKPTATAPKAPSTPEKQPATGAGAVPHKAPPSSETLKSEPILSPAARAIASEKGLNPADIAGTGRGGRVTKEDAVAANGAAKPPVSAAQPAVIQAPSAPRADRAENRNRMTPIRQRIAERLLQAQATTASLTTFNEADMSAIMELRTKYKEVFSKKHGVNLGFMSFFVKAVCEAARAFPLVNSRIEGNEVITPNFVDCGVAVSTEKGLMVPILRDADQMGFARIEKAIGELAVKARDGKIGIGDLQGGTITITNGGVFGSMMSTPILNPPQSAILGMHSIVKRAVAVNDAVVIRPMMYLALTYDHRVIDGREAVQFLVRVKECVEAPERMLFEI